MTAAAWQTDQPRSASRRPRRLSCSVSWRRGADGPIGITPGHPQRPERYAARTELLVQRRSFDRETHIRNAVCSRQTRFAIIDAPMACCLCARTARGRKRHKSPRAQGSPAQRVLGVRWLRDAVARPRPGPRRCRSAERCDDCSDARVSVHNLRSHWCASLELLCPSIGRPLTEIDAQAHADCDVVPPRDEPQRRDPAWSRTRAAALPRLHCRRGCPEQQDRSAQGRPGRGASGSKRSR